MNRDPQALANESFDLLVVGGGIHGAFAAWDAALRGLKVALIERGDFGGATSSNSLKIAHGGLRHLQRGDLRGVLESLDEQIALRRMAPHLVRPLECAMELRGGSVFQNRATLAVALRAYALLSEARGRRLHAAEWPAPGRLLNRSELRVLADLWGGDEPKGSWRSGIAWWDALMESPERLLIGIVRAAGEAGAVVTSYVEARSVRRLGGVITVTAVDRAGLAAQSAEGAGGIEIRTRLVLNAAGPWAPELSERWGLRAPPALARACNIVVRLPASLQGATTAVALRHPSEPRMLFAVPWRGRLMIGTSYVRAEVAGGQRPRADQVSQLLADFNASAPGMHLRLDDVVLVHGGLLPAVAAPNSRGNESVVPLASRPILIDHARQDGFEGIVSMVGTKWTTARRVAERAVDLCQRRLGVPVRRGGTESQAIVGSPVRPADEPAKATMSNHGVGGRAIYGTVSAEIDAIVSANPATASPLTAESAVSVAQVVHAVKREGAVHLDDIVLRRTDMGTAGPPADEELSAAARVAAAELKWDDGVVVQELARVRQAFEWQRLADG